MNKAQLLAIRKLKLALDTCHYAGLKGGVFDTSFCVWPIDSAVDPFEGGSNFFRIIEEHGAILNEVKMSLDGGAGV